MATIKQQIGAGIASMFILAGNAVAQTPRVQQQASEGAQVCGVKPEEMLKFRDAATQFSRYDKAGDKVFFTEMKDGKRVEVNISEQEFAKRSMDLAAKPPKKGTPECPSRYWAAQALNDATLAFSPPQPNQ